MIILISFWSLCLLITAFLMVSSARHDRKVLKIRESMARHLCSANQSIILTAENGDVLFFDSGGGVHKYTKEEFCEMLKRKRNYVKEGDVNDESNS